eukprot:6813999-Karenia_brevis.AAC.1
MQAGKKQQETSRVMMNEDDPRVQEDEFLTEPAIFPNKNIKYEVTKTRARIFAAASGQAVTWAPARDCPS